MIITARPHSEASVPSPVALMVVSVMVFETALLSYVPMLMVADGRSSTLV